MTIKLPEPTAFSIFDYEGSESLYLMENNEELYKHYQQQDAKALDNLYTEAQLKQAIKDALDEAAGLIADRATKHSKLAMAVYHPGDALALEAFVFAEETVRKLSAQTQCAN